MRRRSLPISLCEDPQLRVDAVGRPVFPVWSQRVHDDLVRLAQLFGAGVQIIKSSPTLTPFVTTPEHVIALEPEAGPSARLYAHLSGRHYAGEAGARPIRSEATAVAVGTYASWSNDLWRWLVNPAAQDAVTGLVIGNDVEALTRQVVLRAAALFLSGVPLIHRVAFLAHLPVGVLVDDSDVVVGRQASAQEAREAIALASEGPSALAIVGHSDGIDAQVTDHLVMCPLLDAEPRYASNTAMDCLRSGHCYRTDRPRSIADGDGRLISPTRFEAALLVHDSCGVLPTANIRVEPRVSLGARLIEDCIAGALLVNADMSIGNVTRAARLLQDIAAGTPLGRAVGRFNAANTTLASRRLVLIGDPAIRFCGEDQLDHSQGGPEDLTAPAADAAISESQLVDPDLQFSRSLLGHMRPVLKPDPDNPVFRRWDQQLDGLEAVQSSVDRRILLQECAAAQTACFTYDPTSFPHSHWLPEASLTDVPASQACFCCSCPMETMSARFARGFRARLLAICPNCTACIDSPLGATMDFTRLAPNRFGLKAEFQHAPAVAELFFHAPFAHGRYTRRWPTTKRGALTRYCIADLSMAPAAWMVGVFVSFGTQFAFALAPAPWSIWQHGASRFRPGPGA
jgi:hypothetical protein